MPKRRPAFRRGDSRRRTGRLDFVDALHLNLQHQEGGKGAGAMVAKSLLLSLLFASAAFAQGYSTWGRIDTVTSGNSNDFNPVLDHGGLGDWGTRTGLIAQWLILERRTPSGCHVVAKRFLNRQVKWDTTEYVLSSEAPAGEILHPDVASISDTSALAVWQQPAGGRQCIYFSTWNGVAWTEAHAITSDTMEESQPKVRVWSGYDAGVGFEVKFILGWVRDSSVVFTTYSDSGFGEFQTVAKSNYDSTQFDLFPHYYSAGVIWTIKNSDGSKTLCTRFVEPFSPHALFRPDTLQFKGEVIDPHFATDLGISVLFDSRVNNRWVPYNAYIGEIIDTSSQWLELDSFSGSDTTSDILNPQYWSWPMIIDGLGKSERGFSTTYFPRGWSIYERIADHDTSLVFGDYYYYSDTVVTSGYNRNPSIGSFIFGHGDTTSGLAAWESNRSGKSRIYSRMFNVSIGAVKEHFPASSFYLAQNYPNPFNPTTRISYQLSAVSHVRLAIYDVLGRKVETLVDSQQLPGEHSVVFDGRGLASGVYFSRLQSNGYTQVRKMILMK